LRVISIESIAKELNLPYEIVFNELTELLHELEDKREGFFIVEASSKNVFVLDNKDLEFILNGYGKLKFIDLLDYFQLSPKAVNWIVEELFKKNLIDKKTLRYYTGVKDKPCIKAWFEPNEVVRGEEVVLNIEINSLMEIKEPKISVSEPEGVKLVSDSISLVEILKGKSLITYTYEATKPGLYNVAIHFEGLIGGVQFISDRVVSDNLKVKPFPPEISVSVPISKISAVYNEECEVILKFHNKGKDDAQNVVIKGFENYPEFSVLSKPVVGVIPGDGKLEFPIKLIPRKSGTYIFDKLSLSYEDLVGKKFEFPIPTFEIDITTLKPRIIVDLIGPYRVPCNQTFNLSVRITNIGEGDAYNIRFKLPSIDRKLAKLVFGPEQVSISKLGANTPPYELRLQFKALKEGEITIENFDLKFEDEEGNETVRKYEGTTIIVEEAEKPPERKKVLWPFTFGNHLIGGKFKLIEEIGEGESSKVFLCKDIYLKKEVALKALKPEFTSDPDIVQEFIEGAGLAQDLKYGHHIVSVFQVDKEELAGKVYPYIVMEYVKGGSLAEKIQAGERLNFAECLHVISDICKALTYAHQQGVIHCDVNPSNIFYDNEKDQWKLGDFGIAKIAFKGRITSRRGALWYAAPEAREGIESDKSDVYSLGVVFRELLTGDPRGDLTRLGKTHRQISPEVIKEVVLVIHRMTSLDPSERPSVQEVSKIIKKLTLRTGLRL